MHQHVTHSAHPASFSAHTIAHSSVRSIFSGHTNSKAGYSYRIWSLFRVLCFVAISMSPLSPIRTVVFVILLVCSRGMSLYRIPPQCARDAPSAASHKVLATLLFEGLTQPRTTNFMSSLDRLEELVVAVVALLGLLASGALIAPCRTMP